MSLKIVFMGTPDFSIPTLKTLLNSNHKILYVYSQPAKKANRGQKINSTPIELFSKENFLKIRTPESLDSEEEFNFLKDLNPDLVIVVAYGKIIPKRFLNIPKYGFFNVHASLLPKWRGAAPIQRSIMNLDTETGISIMKITEKLDAGPVILQEKIKINENIDTLTLSRVLSELGARAMLNSLDEIIDGKAKFIDQNHKQATYAKKILKSEAKIDWKKNAKSILAKINGLNPNPGAWFEYDNQRFKVWKAKIINEKNKVGTIINNNLTIACRDQSIQILQIQKEGKNRQSTEQFLTGNKINKGIILN
tara:strand:+ start:1543 stop:2463 length:921 start_codon:yes stop_codon:yes gene_type:complete